MLKSTAFWIGVTVGLLLIVADAFMRYIAIVVVLLVVVCLLMLREWNGIPPKRRR
jgi:hypothetical protein